MCDNYQRTRDVAMRDICKHALFRLPNNILLLHNNLAIADWCVHVAKLDYTKRLLRFQLQPKVYTPIICQYIIDRTAIEALHHIWKQKGSNMCPIGNSFYGYHRQISAFIALAIRLGNGRIVHELLKLGEKAQSKDVLLEEACRSGNLYAVKYAIWIGNVIASQYANNDELINDTEWIRRAIEFAAAHAHFHIVRYLHRTFGIFPEGTGLLETIITGDDIYNDQEKKKPSQQCWMDKNSRQMRMLDYALKHYIPESPNSIYIHAYPLNAASRLKGDHVMRKILRKFYTPIRDVVLEQSDINCLLENAEDTEEPILDVILLNSVNMSFGTACKWGHLKKVKYLMRHYPISLYKKHPIHTYKSRTQRMLTPLQIACWYGHLDVMQYLISKGCDPHIDEDFCFLYACKHGFTRIVQYLLPRVDLTNKVWVEEYHERRCVHVPYMLGEIAFIWACNKARMGVIRTLAPHVINQANSAGIFIGIAECTCIEVFRMVRDHFMRNNICITPMMADAALMHRITHYDTKNLPGWYSNDDKKKHESAFFAAPDKHMPFVKILLDMGADVRHAYIKSAVRTNTDGWFASTPDHTTALYSKSIAITWLQLLLKHVPMESYQIALNMALGKATETGVVKWLIERGADIDACRHRIIKHVKSQEFLREYKIGIYPDTPQALYQDNSNDEDSYNDPNEDLDDLENDDYFTQQYICIVK